MMEKTAATKSLHHGRPRLLSTVNPSSGCSYSRNFTNCFSILELQGESAHSIFTAERISQDICYGITIVFFLSLLKCECGTAYCLQTYITLPWHQTCELCKSLQTKKKEKKPKYIKIGAHCATLCETCFRQTKIIMLCNSPMCASRNVKVIKLHCMLCLDSVSAP